MTLAFVDTRSRSTDAATSRVAARNAATHKANSHRAQIAACLRAHGPLNAHEISFGTLINYHAVQRRLSETGGIEVTNEVRDGCRVWKAI